jgi:hypothetical protein
MKESELFAKMLIMAAEHLYSLECYDDFPSVPRQKIDEEKELIQQILRKLALKSMSDKSMDK